MAIELLGQHTLDLVLLRVASDPEGATEARQTLEEAADRLTRSPGSQPQRLVLADPSAAHAPCDWMPMSLRRVNGG